MATGRVDVSRRGDFYGHSKKENDHYRNATHDLKSSGGYDHGSKHRNGYYISCRISSTERNLGVRHKNGYHISSKRHDSGHSRVEAQKDDGVQFPPEKKRKFSPIIWDREDKEVKISSSNRIVPASTILPPSRLVGEVLDVVSDGGSPDYPASENQVKELEFSSVKPHMPELLALASPLLPQQQNVGSDCEEGQLEEEALVQALNIATSRWASDSDSPRDISLSDDEDRPKSEKQVRKSSTPESGEFLREDSEGYMACSSGSDGRGYSVEPANADEFSENEFESESVMDIDDTNGESIGVDQFELDVEEPTVSTQGGLNMLHGSRSVFEYERLNKINEGTYGVVYRARDKKTGDIVALKKVKMDVGRDDGYGFPLTSLREINILLSFNHPSIVNVKEVVVDNFDSVFMVMEHLEHDLKGVMELLKQPFSTSEVKSLMLQLLEGVQYLHNNWVIHRDLKPANLLYNNKGELKIADFGMSRQYGSPLKPYTQLVVTQWYRAPELLLGAKQYSTAVDMWSVGCIMAELLSRKPIFQGKSGSDFDQLNKIFGILGKPSETIWPGFSGLPGGKANFACQSYNLLRKNFPVTSFTGSPVLSDLGLDLLNKLLTYDPEKRITADAALRHDWFREVPLPKSKEFMPTFRPRYA